MEIPTHHLDHISEHTDFDYALCHEVFKSGPDGAYTKFYRKQAREGREVWLDNGVNELGTPMDIDDIIRAGELIEATHLIAPDYFHDGAQTLTKIYQMKERLAKHSVPFKLIGVWQGEKKDLRRTVRECDVTSLPYRKLRDKYMSLDEFASTDFHYLGFRTLDELRRYPPKSIDTSMPIRAAVHGIDLQSRDRRPRTEPLNIQMRLSERELEASINNIKLLREAGEWKSKNPTTTPY
jgi:hypothetical protein